MEKFKNLKYSRPDFTALEAALKAKLELLKSAKSYSDYREAFLDTQKLTDEASTMASLAYIRNTLDTTDSFYEAEVLAFNEGFAKLGEVSQAVSKTLLDTPFREEFTAEFGSIMIQEAEAEQKLFTPEIIPLKIKEGELTQEYSKIAASCKTNFRGEECNFYGLLKHMQSTDRQERKEAFEAWSALYESISEKLDSIYDELVALRVKTAEILGFDNYIDMVYLSRGRYDYNKKDVECFREQVAKIITPACAELFEAQKKRLGIDKLEYYDESLVFPEGNAVPSGTKDEMIEAAKQMYCELSPETGEFFDFMTEYELFDLDTRAGKHLGGYCTNLALYKAPFIFSNFNGTSADVDVLTHEAGHAFEYYVASRKLPISSLVHSTSEINEIHSMTMELFTYPWMEKFFGENVDKYRFAHLADALKVIPYLVSVDEFQHRVFENPSMTAAERRSVWRGIEKKYMPWRSYDGNDFLENGGFWMQKQHIFLYPFYYVDYALAQLCAFEFYGKSLENRKEAWNDYLSLCMAGGSKGYFALLEHAHLHNPFREGSVEAAVKVVLDELGKAEY